jgi:hypothetical protein
MGGMGSGRACGGGGDGRVGLRVSSLPPPNQSAQPPSTSASSDRPTVPTARFPTAQMFTYKGIVSLFKKQDIVLPAWVHYAAFDLWVAGELAGRWSAGLGTRSA